MRAPSNDPTLATHPSFDDDRFRRGVFHGVVALLEEDLKTLK